MTRKERYKAITDWFESNMPVAETELVYNNPFELIVSVILSAQCTDKRVNMVTPGLFEKLPDPESMSKSDPETIFKYISSVTYPNNKSKHLHQMASMLVSDFDSKVPGDTISLQKLPGVGRKTANVIASVLFDKPVIAVDTHVFRVSRRLGLSSGKTPLAVEQDLTKNFPESKRAIAHHWLILHGRYVCKARNPECDKCGLSVFCRYYHKSRRANLHEGSTG
ncbi:MAG: endonuclease III [Bacteroidales bacterium]|jgi:endonuclease-3|nr:endonuclease III [Bacteroidales bacterium]MDD3299785.1 endonuclease III [Bacteroidales bacterium]MDD3843423.1 endonuclease III [Bacteroidales bacterium]MDD4617656.1 endonuclease III [Bacteroidales bacterium]